MANYDVLVRTPELRAALAGLLGAARRMAEDAGGPPVMTSVPAPAPEGPGCKADDEAPVDAPLW